MGCRFAAFAEVPSRTRTAPALSSEAACPCGNGATRTPRAQGKARSQSRRGSEIALNHETTLLPRRRRSTTPEFQCLFGRSDRRCAATRAPFGAAPALRAPHPIDRSKRPELIQARAHGRGECGSRLNPTERYATGGASMTYPAQHAAVWTASFELFFAGPVNVRRPRVRNGVRSFSPAFQAWQRKDRHLADGCEPRRLEVRDLIDLDRRNRLGRQSPSALLARIPALLHVLAQWADHRA